MTSEYRHKIFNILSEGDVQQVFGMNLFLTIVGTGLNPTASGTRLGQTFTKPRQSLHLSVVVVVVVVFLLTT